jgi:hypothetical protein
MIGGSNSLAGFYGWNRHRVPPETKSGLPHYSWKTLTQTALPKGMPVWAKKTFQIFVAQNSLGLRKPEKSVREILMWAISVSPKPPGDSPCYLQNLIFTSGGSRISLRKRLSM